MKQFGSFALDTRNQCLWQDRAQLALPPKPFAVLQYLVENPGRLISHDELLEALWPETYVQPQVLRTYVLELRKILSDDAAQPRFIRTLPKRGYCFVAEVTDRAEERPKAKLPVQDLTAAAERQMRASSTPDTCLTSDDGGKSIVGRDGELVRLASILQATHEKRQFVFLTGEAGIGKTALIDAFCRQVISPSLVNIARGQCMQGFGGKEEYYPITEVLAQLCASPVGERACQLLARLAPAWLASRQHESSSQTSPHSADRMPGDICAALEELSIDKPILLIFEDLQWADDGTLHLIAALARRRSPCRLMVILAYSPRDLSPDRALRALKQDLVMRRLSTEIALPPLTRSGVVDLLSRQLQQETLPAGLADFIYQHAEGNPLFVSAILEHLIAQGFLTQAKSKPSRWESRTAWAEIEAVVPDDLAQMIELEIQGLTAEEQGLLEAASLMSVAFPAWAVAAALQMDPTEAEEACDSLAQKLYFLKRAGQDELPDGSCSAFYVFAHGIYRELLYRRQGAARRARRHTRIADRLGELFRGREAYVAREMAAHYESASQWKLALNSIRLASGLAQQRSAYPEALQLLEHALRLAEHLPDAERPVVLDELRGEIQLFAEQSA